VLVYAGSTAGPEMLRRGRAVVRFRPEQLLDVDQSEMYGAHIPTANERTLREVVLSAARQTGRPAPPPALPPELEPFAPLDPEALRGVFAKAEAG
jgi:hypothetical protein